MATVEVFLFGASRLRRKGQAVQIRHRKGLALLAHLLLTHQPQRRETLASLFWPESEHALALGNLRRELSRLRGDLPHEMITADRQQVELVQDLDVWVDVLSFRELTERVSRFLRESGSGTTDVGQPDLPLARNRRGRRTGEGTRRASRPFRPIDGRDTADLRGCCPAGGTERDRNSGLIFLDKQPKFMLE